MILDRISVKRHNTVRSNDPNSNTLTELLTLFTYRTIDPFHVAEDCGVTGSLGAVDVSKEQIILWNPDIIIVAHSFGESLEEMNDVDRILSDPDLQTVDAVKNHRVYFSMYPYCCGTPHDRNLANMMYLAKLFHPEEFEDLDVEEEGNEIYEKFLGVDGLFTEYADATIWLREWLDSQ